MNTGTVLLLVPGVKSDCLARQNKQARKSSELLLVGKNCLFSRHGDKNNSCRHRLTCPLLSITVVAVVAVTVGRLVVAVAVVVVVSKGSICRVLDELHSFDHNEISKSVSHSLPFADVMFLSCATVAAMSSHTGCKSAICCTN
jgi:hypothetical protein